MKYSKAFTLLRGTSLPEQKRLKADIKVHKRVTLQRLFNLLLSKLNADEPDSPEVYKLVFKKSYSKKLDYLIRNEYRLLYDWLVNNITRDNPSEGNSEAIALLLYLLNNNIHELFEEEFRALWKQAVQHDDIEFMLQLSDLNIRYHMEGKSQSLANAEATATLSQQRIELLQLSVLRQIRAEEIRLRMSERIISAYKPGKSSAATVKSIALDNLQKGDLYAQYLSKRARINAAKGDEKITLLLSILENEEIIRKYETKPTEALCRFWLNLAQEYYLSNRFSDALTYYSKAEPYLTHLPLPLQETFILNFVMALMRNENFTQARKLATANEQILLNSKILAGRSPFLLAMLHLYERDADGADKFVLLDSKKEGSEFYFFMRLVLSAVYYLRGDLDLAVREGINLDQAVNYELNRDQTLQTRISKPIISVFRRFYMVVQSATSDKMNNELKTLADEINSSLSANNDQSPNSILTQWLKREIALRMKKTKRSK